MEASKLRLNDNGLSSTRIYENILNGLIKFTSPAYTISHARAFRLALN